MGAVALVATGVGALATVGALGAAATTGTVALGLTATALTTVGALAGVAAGVLSYAAQLTAPKLGRSVEGDQTKWTANKDQGIPWAFGRTSVSGWIIHRATWDYGSSSDNAYQTFVAVRSGMPTYQIESFSIDGTPITFAGDAALGNYAGFMWLNQQHGGMPEAIPLPATSFKPTFPGWTGTSKLSGLDAYTLTLKWDSKGKKYPSGPPEPTTVLKGAMVYDPRKDSTYPGGVGSHRADDPATWEFTERGPLLGLAWARGLYQHGKRVLGIGMALAAIDVPAFVEAANIADANDWSCGGVVYSTDGKWSVLKKFLATCAGEPLPLGGQLSCVVSAPRVPLATITTADIIGDWSVVNTPRSKDRINGIIPTYRSEAHGWELVPADPVTVPEYIAEDRRPVTRGLTWELVQDVDQLAELALYEICNAREFGPIVLPLRIEWIGYRPGDCLTIQSPEIGLENQDVIIRRRNLDPASGGVTLTMWSETAAKHAFALGETGTPPPTPSPQVVDRERLLIPGYSAGWTGVIDDDPVNHPKPDDGATNSADPLSPFGPDKRVIDMITDLEEARDQVLAAIEMANGTASALLQAAQIAEYRQQANDALTHIAGAPAKVVLTERIDVVEDGELASAHKLSLIGTMNGAGTAYLLNGATVYVTPTKTFGDYLTEVSASFNGITGVGGTIDAKITNYNSVLTGPGGALASAISAVTTNYQNANKADVIDFAEAMSTDSTTRANALSRISARNGSLAASAVSTFYSAQIGPAGVNAQAISALSASLGAVNASISNLQEIVISADGTAVAKGVLAFDVGGNIAGVYSTVTRTTSRMRMLFSAYEFLAPDGTALIVAEAGVVKMPNVEVDTIRANTIVTNHLTAYAGVAPQLLAATASISGIGYGAGDPAYDRILLDDSVTLARAGTIYAHAIVAMAFPDGDRPWGLWLRINGSNVFAVGGDKTSDSVSLAGSVAFPAAGTYSVQLVMQAHGSVSARGRNLSSLRIY